MKNVGIKAIGQYVPKKVVTNHMLEKMVETSDDWITTRTGIKERRIAGKHERASDLAIHAAKDALKKGEIDPHTIELIVVATISPDSNFPSVACLVQKAIGARQAAAFDVSAACSGFLYALTTAKQFVATGMYKNALVIAAERFSQIIDWNDRDTCVLFGDGAGACVIAPVLGNHGILSEYLHAQGHHSDIMSVIVEDLPPLDQEAKTMNRPYVEMRGQELFKIAVNSMAEAVDIVLKKAKVKKEEVACVVPHQANDRIITAVARKLSIPKDKFLINIHRYGNMSAASIAVALNEAVDHKH
ncbi:MAG: ketoacyl-ACP synthase III, partial [Hyphomicrobiaceae bacterium]|nr:ketoacyl-ACP synthase III [Hyphomicrobiaceae bacterium]